MNLKVAVVLTIALCTAPIDAAVRCSGTTSHPLSVQSGQRFDLPVVPVAGTLDYEVQRTASWQMIPNDIWVITGEVMSTRTRPASGAAPTVHETVANSDPEMTQGLYYVVTATNQFDPAFQPCSQDFLVSITPDPLLARDSTRIVVPVVASLLGAHDSVFRTRLLLENATESTVSGNLVFHPTGGGATKSLAYSIPSRSHKEYVDVVLATGANGMGSLDVVPDPTPFGHLAPRVTAELDTLVLGGEFVTQIPSVSMTDREFGAVWTSFENPTFLIGDLSSKRYNIGLRSLSDEVSLTAFLTAADGTEKASVHRVVAADTHLQMPINDFLGTTVAQGDTVEIIAMRKSGLLGGVIVYLAATDNVTNDVRLEVPNPTKIRLHQPIVACSEGAGCRLVDPYP